MAPPAAVPVFVAVFVAVAAIVPVFVAVPDGVFVAVLVLVGVCVWADDVFVGSAVWVEDGVFVAVAVFVGKLVAVRIGGVVFGRGVLVGVRSPPPMTAVEVMVGVFVDVRVGVAVRVFVAVRVAVWVLVGVTGVFVRVLVAVAVFVNVAVGAVPPVTLTEVLLATQPVSVNGGSASAALHDSLTDTEAEPKKVACRTTVAKVAVWPLAGRLEELTVN